MKFKQKNRDQTSRSAAGYTSRKLARPQIIKQVMLMIISVVVPVLSGGQRAAAQAIHGAPISASANPTTATQPIRAEPIAAAKPSQTSTVETATKVSPPAPEAKSATASASVAGPATNAVTDKVATVASKKTEEPKDVGFDLLGSYEYEVSDKPLIKRTNTVDEADKQIPTAIKAYDQQQVLIKGFMVPMQVDGDKTSEFMILQNQMSCCFGIAPRINEWVTVKVPGKGVSLIMDQPVIIRGTLHVGTIRDADGFIIGVYQMDGEKLSTE